MNTFGTLKNKILKKLTDVYSEHNMSEVKKIVKILKENKEIKKMYLFYDDFENKYMEDKNSAETYVNEMSVMLSKEGLSLLPKVKTLNKVFNDVITEKNDVYNNLDVLLTTENLFNIDRRIVAKKNLVDHLMKKKEMVIEEDKETYTTNEPLLYNLLSNNFNVLYESTLTNEEKKELKTIINLTQTDLNRKISDLKENVLEQIEILLVENGGDEISKKLIEVKLEIDSMKDTKLNFYRLKELETGLF